jgi:hypothetical protein
MPLTHTRPTRVSHWQADLNLNHIIESRPGESRVISALPRAGRPGCPGPGPGGGFEMLATDWHSGTVS